MKLYQTVVELLQARAINQPQQTAYTFLLEDEKEGVSLSYETVELQARAIGSRLQAMGLTKARALVVYPYQQSLEFIAGFFGCLYGGVVAVTDNPPRNAQGILKLEERVRACEASVVLSTQALLQHLEQQLAKNPQFQTKLTEIPWIATDLIPLEEGNNWQPPDINKDTLAFLQYTSGSTGTPKGVMVTHGNIIANSAVIYEAFKHSQETKCLIWLPLFHDMGLLGGVMQPVYGAFPVVLMSPVSIIQRPWRWLEAITWHKITTSGSANFAYDLLCQQGANRSLENLDLSSWDVAFSGAEPVRAETIEAFSSIFAPCGFRREAFYPCYGMAETTLFVSGGDKSSAPPIIYIDKSALEKNLVVTVDSTHPQAKKLVGCGRPWLGDQVVIVNPDSLTLCAANQVGEIWVRGSGVGQGYWHQPEETSKTFGAYLSDTQEGPFLRTGDLGFFEQGELYIAGRLKDMIILWGRNHYPQHLELTVEKSYPGLRPNCGAAFAVEVNSEERLLIVQEVERTHLSSLNVQEAIAAIRLAIAQQHIAEVYGIVLIKTGTIPKTSSGKVQRRRTREQFFQGTLEAIASWQISAQEETTIVDMINS